jgi:hypothetical protein
MHRTVYPLKVTPIIQAFIRKNIKTALINNSGFATGLHAALNG